MNRLNTAYFATFSQDNRRIRCLGRRNNHCACY